MALAFVALACAGLSIARAETAFLEPQQAFVYSVRAADERSVEVRFDITSGYYLYRERLQFSGEGATLGTPALPAGKVKFDQTFQKDVETYRGELKIRIPVTAASGPFKLTVISQGCADAGLCYPPMSSEAMVSLLGFGGDGSARVVDASNDTQSSPAQTPKGLNLSALSGAPQAASAPGDRAATEPAGPGGRIEQLLRGGSWWATLGTFWLMGLLLSFTPCVLPMLPILSSIIAGSGDVSRRRSFALSLAYTLGMALVYTALGVAAGLAGEGLAAALQKPWVLAAFALLLAGFALSMFDVYELRLPSSLSNRLDGVSRQLPGGRLVGVFLMGGLSALIVSPCVTAPLAGALLFLSQTRDVVLAGSALFALAVGMSMPLLLLGASAGAWLPRSGAWMHAVKRFFGLLLLGVAMWVLQPVLPPALVLVGWGGLLLVGGFMLRPFDPNPHSGAPRVWVQRAVGLAALTYGALQLAGAASGGHDPLQPLGHFAGGSSAGQSAAPVNGPADGSRNPAGRSSSAAGLPFEPVRSLAELEQRLQTAGRPVMLDFYADWCVSCKEMERYTFSQPAIQSRLAQALLLKADVTANNADDRALLKHFQLFGPPGTIFFTSAGQELPASRVVGFQSAADFEKTLQGAGL